MPEVPHVDFDRDAREDLLLATAHRLARELRKKNQRLVFAESCTGGLLASLLTEIPGISEFFCGSHVVYREDSKMRWLGVKTTTLARDGAVSAATAEEMVRGALLRTPEADIAAAVTGFLGPKGDRVGRVFISVLKRGGRGRPRTLFLQIDPRKKSRTAETAGKRGRIRRNRSGVAERLERRDLAALATLFLVRSSLDL